MNWSESGETLRFGFAAAEGGESGILISFYHLISIKKETERGTIPVIK